MKPLLALTIAAALIGVAPAAADEPTKLPLHDVFLDVDPCTGLDHTVEVTGTFFRHSHTNGNTYHAPRTITTSSGYIGHGVEVSVDHERILVINDVLANPNGNRLRAHLVLVRDADFTMIRVEQFRLECIGRNARTLAAATADYPNAIAVLGGDDPTGYASNTRHPSRKRVETRGRLARTLRPQHLLGTTRREPGDPRTQFQLRVVSAWGTIDSYVKAVSSLDLGTRLTHAGKGPCSIFAPRTGKVVPEHVAYIKRMTNGYHAASAAACKEVPTCRYDGGAARRIVIAPADLAHRREHLSFRGLAKLAAVEWRVLYGSR